MSVETMPHNLFEFAQKPDILDAQSIGEAVLGWVAKHIPYDPFCGITTAEEGCARGKAVCFGQTLAEVELLEEAFEMPAAIMLNASGESYCHSTAAGLVPEYSNVFERVAFIEPPVYKDEGYVNDLLSEAYVKAQGPSITLPQLMADTLPAAMESGDFCLYYFIDPDFPDDLKKLPHKQPWQVKSTYGIRQFERLQKDGFSFVITDPVQGKAMLNAISKLQYFYEDDRNSYADVYPELIQYVPDFMYFPPPNRLANV